MLPTATVSRSRRHGLQSRSHRSSRDGESVIPKLVFLAALLWPLLPLLMTNQSKNASRKQRLLVVTSELRSRLRDLLDRYDILGYGPTHPRFAFVLVADPSEHTVAHMSQSIRSIFQHTDRKRIFQVYAVFPPATTDLQQSQQSIEASLQALDVASNATHNTWLEFHRAGAERDQLLMQQNNTHDLMLGRKIKVLFSSKTSVAANRRHVARILEIMAEQHEHAGLKSTQEDIILVFIRPGVTLQDTRWMDTATGALIPSPTSSIHSSSFLRHSTARYNQSTSGTFHANKLANAISFYTPSSTLPGYPIRGINWALEDTELSNNMDFPFFSYPTPIVEGSITALRLNTFIHLPAKDTNILSTFAADLELSWNLWLCADGIDVMTAAKADSTFSTRTDKRLSKTDATRLVSAWITHASPYKQRIMDAMAIQPQDLASMDHKITLPTNLDTKCRSFEWYVTNINNSSMIDTTHWSRPKGHGDHVLVQERLPINHPDTMKDKLPPAINPLRPSNRDIVSKTHPIHLAYTNVTQDFKQHPHRGAQDSNGNFGYIHDEIALRNDPPTFVPPPKDVACKKDADYKMLTEKVVIRTQEHNQKEKAANDSGIPRKKLFCIVYTIQKNHHRIPVIRETWGPKCDGFLVSSDVTDPSLGTVHIPHEGPEEYGNIWQKVRSTWSYVYDNYYDQYDFFHIGGDDLYILVENLRLYLESDEITLAANGGVSLPTGNETSAYPLFLGRRFAEQGKMNRIFNSGGAGYTLNKAALKALVVDAFPVCFPHLRTFAEDVMVAECLREHLQVFPYDTKDDQGGERYMPFTPAHHLTYRLPPEADRKDSSDWYVHYSIDIKEGLDHCAADAVTFHYIDKDLMRRMHAVLYGHCS